jgi:hypothetical protein
MQNYKGVTAYNSLNNPGYINFLQALDIPFMFGCVSSPERQVIL